MFLKKGHLRKIYEFTNQAVKNMINNIIDNVMPFSIVLLNG